MSTCSKTTQSIQCRQGSVGALKKGWDLQQNTVGYVGCWTVLQGQNCRHTDDKVHFVSRSFLTCALPTRVREMQPMWPKISWFFSEKKCHLLSKLHFNPMATSTSARQSPCWDSLHRTEKTNRLSEGLFSLSLFIISFQLLKVLSKMATPVVRRQSASKTVWTSLPTSLFSLPVFYHLVLILFRHFTVTRGFVLFPSNYLQDFLYRTTSHKATSPSWERELHK